MPTGLGPAARRIPSPISSPAPPGPLFSAQAISVVAGGDRWLLTTDWRTGDAELSEIATGTVVRHWNQISSFGFGRPAPVSQDGRWLLDVSVRSAPAMVDLDSGREWPIELRLRGEPVVAILDLTGTAFAP